MSLCSYSFKCNGAFAAIVVSIFVGIVTTFLHVTGVITVTPVFLWITFGIAIVFLGVLLATAPLARRNDSCSYQCSVLSALLLGILGTILFSVVLLAVGITATSLLSAILVGLLLFFFSLILTGTACYVRCLADCGN